MSRFNFLNPSAAAAEVLAAGRRDDDMATVVRALTARTTGKVSLRSNRKSSFVNRKSSDEVVVVLGTTPAGHELRANASKQGIEIKFASKPDDAVLAVLKAGGPNAVSWKWSRFSGVWYARDTAEARAWAKDFLSSLSASASEADGERAGVRCNTITDGAPAATSINPPPPTTAPVIPAIPPPVAPAPSASFLCEVCCQGEWASNGLRFATEAEAEAYGKNLLSRWFVPTGSRAVPSTEPATHRFEAGKLLPIPPAPPIPKSEIGNRKSAMVLDNPPPGGWTEADRVPNEHRQPWNQLPPQLAIGNGKLAMRPKPFGTIARALAARA